MSSIYKNMSIDEMQDLQSQFLIESWSYSKASCFARNEKAFEMQYIYGIYGRSSATTVAGNAYHEALKYYFSSKKEGKQLDFVELEKSAFQYIDEIPANRWKIQKTTPTIEDCILKATKTSSALLKNFMEERGIYEDEIEQILEVEVRILEYLTVNGVDIPLPCSAVIDLVAKLKSGAIVIIDHKSKAAYTDEEEVALSIGEQAITYVLSYEERTGSKVNEVWFVENKYSQNKDGSPQLHSNKVVVDENTRRLYEAMLYEPIKRMIEAVSNPEYVYLINQYDNLTDKAELYDHWARTMICEVEDFNVPEAKKELVAKRLKKIRDASIQSITPSVIKKFKENASAFIQYDLSNKDMTKQEKIEHVLRSFGTIVKVAHTKDGFSCDTFLLEVSAGVPIRSIHSRKLDIANALDVSNVRISNEMKVFEGKSYVAIEVSKKRSKYLRFDPDALKGMKIPIGMDNFGEVIYWDWDNHSTPHALIGGATGSGKSACITSIIEYARLANVDNIIIFDPKNEFINYSYCGDARFVVVSDIEAIEDCMAKLVEKMNELVRKGKKEKTLVVFDEFADAVSNSRKGNELKIYKDVVSGMYASGAPKMKRECVGELKSLEENLRLLLQKGRSSGFRIVAATQRASVKVITGDAKVNFPVQICFRVPKEVDSKVMLDEPGAESLMGMGDGLIKSPEYNDTVRFQGYFYTEKITA